MAKTISANSVPASPSKAREFIRFSLSERVGHFLLLLSFTLLGITGLAQKFSANSLADAVIGLFGGIESTRIVHRVSAVVLMVVSIAHIVAAAYRVYVRRRPMAMLPDMSDLRHLIHDIRFYIGKEDRKAYYGRYNYAEKVEYLAVVWGTIIMAITGFMMWNPIATTRLLSGEWIPAAKAAHGGEALLAVLAIILWHFYHVHLRHFNKSMFTGKMTEEEMRHEHPAELDAILAGKAHRDPSPEVVRRRQQVFLPFAAVTVLVLGFGLVKFITFEQTAIATLPRGETAPAFVPITPTPTATVPAPPTATPGAAAPEAGTGAVAWDNTIAPLLTARCNACHIAGAMGGLSLADYASAVKGGDKGPAIVPGDPNASVLVQVQSAGGHPGQLAPEGLQTVIDWIAAGAPETSGGGGAAPAAPGATPAAPSAPASNAWPPEIGQIIETRCGACHIAAQLGGLSLVDLSWAQRGGGRGPAIVPGDAEKSVLVQVQREGNHPGQLTAVELQTIVDWINAGAGAQSAAAPSAPAVTPAATTTGGALTWQSGIADLFAARCNACHVAARLGNVSLASYQDALDSQSPKGAAIVPGDPTASQVVVVQQAGGHPGQLTPEEIQSVIDWIAAGALEK